MVNAKPFGGLNCKRAPLREETSHSAYLEPWVQGSGWGASTAFAKQHSGRWIQIRGLLVIPLLVVVDLLLDLLLAEALQPDVVR